ncbi:MAG TPA: hypothetical protein VHL80_21880 [Polyangia bacterium]|nr:hypothetical protein [Polyangia bacterium]
MKPIVLVLPALLAACEGPPPSPREPDAAAGDADAAVSDAAADGTAASDGASSPEAAPDAGSPALFQPAPATSCTAVHLVVDGGFLYWTDEAGGAVMRAPTAGGAPSAVAVGEDHPTWLSVRGGRVFWVSGVPGSPPVGNPTHPTLGTSMRAAAPGGGPTTIASVAGGLYGAVVTDDGATVYFSTGAAIEQVSAGGGTPSNVATFVDGSTARGLAISGTTLVALDDVDGFVALVDLTAGPALCGQLDPTSGSWTGSCTRLPSDNGSLLSDTILVDGTVLYWVDGDRIKHADLAGGPDVAATPADASFIDAACLGGSSVFFVADDHALGAPAPGTLPAGTSLIEKATSDPDVPNVVLARGQRRPQSIASDGARVFWATADCAIWSLAP